MSKVKIIINFVVFQIAWFACVLGAAHGMPWQAFLFVLIAVFSQLMLNNINLKNEILLIALIAIIGAIFDQMIINHQLILYQSHGWNNAIVPIWIIGLWIAFASTINLSLRWLRDYPLVAILFGAIGGPLAYLGAEKLGAVTLSITPDSIIALAVGWGLLMPIILKIAQKFDGYQHV
jgi:hypothetical protein